MLKSLIKNTDYYILAITFILVAIGVVGIYSAGYTSTVSSDEYIKQIIWFCGLLVVMIFIWAVDYKFFDFGGYLLYIASIVLLVMVLFMPKIMGARSWFNFGFFLYQPSELMKIAYILTFAKFISIFNESNRFSNISKILIGGAVFFIPLILILLQPDFGTAIVFVVITFFMLYTNKLKYKYILIAIGLVIIIAPLVYFFLLNGIQQERILVFLDPTRDPLGSGYNAIQSKLAIGSGMLFGTGLLNGTQTQFGYLPIKSSDFIYSVISEEFGFIMSVSVIILFTILILRLLYIAKNTKDTFGKLIIMGITGMIFFHFVQNIGMTIGLLPITGIPLPFVSYGGSSLMTNLIAIAIVLNISARKSKNIFLD